MYESPVYTSPMGDPMYVEQDSLIVHLTGRRGVVSSSNLSGGYRQDIKYIFNHSCAHHPYVVEKTDIDVQELNLDTYFRHLAMHLGLPPECTTGMDTAADIQNIALSTREAHGVTVMTLATAGIDINGGRAGDPASYDEFTHTGITPKAGTINILTFIDARLSAGVLTRAIVTATEAKSAALQELMANSMYSEGIATGSGTDGIVIVANDDSDIPLYSSGKHVLLGEMIGLTVKEAVTEALSRQTGMDKSRQAHIEWQSKRYGITLDNIYRRFEEKFGRVDQSEALWQILHRIDEDQYLVAHVAALTHLCDQNRWGILSDSALLSMTNTITTDILTCIPQKSTNESASLDSTGLPAYRQALDSLLDALAERAHLLFSTLEQ